MSASAPQNLPEPDDLAQHRIAERDHWEHQKHINRRTLAISGLALFANAATAGLSIWALHAALKSAIQTGRQAEAAYNDQRPWLVVEVKLTNLSIRKNEGERAWINVPITSTNIGRSPATNVVYAITSDVVRPEMIKTTDAQKAQCDDADRQAVDDSANMAVFPNHSTSQPNGIAVEKLYTPQHTIH